MLTKATERDKERIKAFYMYTAANTRNIREYCRWSYGLHPTSPMIEEYINDGNMYFMEENGNIVCALAITFFQGEDYHNTDWALSLPDDMVSVLHLLAVRPDRQRTGLGRKAVEEAVALSKEKGMKAVRLDALQTNAPALSLYASLGFSVRGKENWFVENTGNTDFLLLEKVI